MRILMLSWEYPPYILGGSGRHVTELLNSFGQFQPDAPLSVDVLTHQIAGGAAVERVNPAVTVFRVDIPMPEHDLYASGASFDPIFSDQAHQLASSSPYDLIHLHGWPLGRLGLALTRHWQIPLVLTQHSVYRGYERDAQSNAIDHRIDQLERQICTEAAQVIVCSHFMRAELHRLLGVPAAKIQVIPNGINAGVGKSYTLEQLATLRRQYAPANEKLLFFIGQVRAQKGLLVLLRALPSILSHHPNLRLLIAGDHGGKLLPLVYELNMEHAVDFLGYISDEERDALYQIVDAAIFPSLYEPFGIVALEAMNLGCNVIASDVGGLGEVVKHRETGLLVPPNDPHAIVEAVNQLFADPVAAEQRRSHARREIETRYRWHQIGGRTIQVYGSTIEYQS